MKLLFVVAALLLFTPDIADAQIGRIIAGAGRAARPAARTADEAAEAAAAAARRGTQSSATSRTLTAAEILGSAQRAESIFVKQRSFVNLNVRVEASAVRMSNSIVSLPDVLTFTLSVGLISPYQTNPDPVMVELAANRVQGNNTYHPLLCEQGSSFVAVTSNTLVCPSGALPTTTMSPLDLSVIPIRTAGPPNPVPRLSRTERPPMARQATFDFEQVVRGNPEQWAYYERLRAEFPSVYNGLVSDVNNRVRSGASEQAVLSETFAFMDRFFRQQVSYLSHAEPGVLAALSESQLQLMSALRDANPTFCADIFLERAIDPVALTRLGRPVEAAMIKASSVVLDAIVSGRRNPQDYEPLSDEHWAELLFRLESQKIKREEVEAFGNPGGSPLSASRACDVGVAMYREINLLPSAWRARFMAELFRSE